MWSLDLQRGARKSAKAKLIVSQGENRTSVVCNNFILVPKTHSKV